MSENDNTQPAGDVADPSEEKRLPTAGEVDALAEAGTPEVPTETVTERVEEKVTETPVADPNQE